MKRTSKYYYDENEKLTLMETHETYEKGDLCDGREGYDEGVLLEECVGLPSIDLLSRAAVILASVSLGISIARLLRDK